MPEPSSGVPIDTPSSETFSTVKPSAQQEGAKETRIRFDHTLRGVREYADHLGFESEEEFLSFIKGKKICDVGSGYGGLAIDVRLRGLDTEITSVNPALNDTVFKEAQRKKLSQSFGESYTPEQIEDALAFHDEHAIPALAENLPLEGNRFDAVFDCFAVTYYAHRIGTERYRKSVAEMMRILKPGGSLRIAERARIVSDVPEAKILREAGRSFRIINHPHADSKNPVTLGAEIIK